MFGSVTPWMEDRALERHLEKCKASRAALFRELGRCDRQVRLTMAKATLMRLAETDPQAAREFAYKLDQHVDTLARKRAGV